MKELRNAGLICGHKEGAKIVYCLDIEKFAEMEETMSKFLNEIHLPADFYCSMKTSSDT